MVNGDLVWQQGSWPGVGLGVAPQSSWSRSKVPLRDVTEINLKGQLSCLNVLRRYWHNRGEFVVEFMTEKLSKWNFRGSKLFRKGKDIVLCYRNQWKHLLSQNNVNTDITKIAMYLYLKKDEDCKICGKSWGERELNLHLLWEIDSHN